MNSLTSPKAYPLSLQDSEGNSTIPERFGQIKSLVRTGFRRMISQEKITLPQIGEALGNPLLLDASERNKVDFITEIGQGYTGMLRLGNGGKWTIEDLIKSVQEGWTGIHRADEGYFKVFHTGSQIFHGRARTLYLLIHTPLDVLPDIGALIETQKSQPDWVEKIQRIF